MTYLTNSYKHTHIVCIYYVHGFIYSHTIMMLALLSRCMLMLLFSPKIYSYVYSFNYIYHFVKTLYTVYSMYLAFHHLFPIHCSQLDNPQWLIDFAQLTKSQFNASVEEVFSWPWSSCAPPEGFQMKPKIPTVESVLEELDHFMGCALFLSINSTK